ncbi:NAD-dependent epimerase/dehydratase family protein [Actinoplanes oblitus]|uniref:NAD-dependent epimerase/dehydratase family protein n=1 Tax=Actinoplanes oblitus TaxID=3040509 RepID=A0ABY8WP80_9ACTN|nr:NAD-dependent epimerase/dehydratase family protein [Actinoplanes oblitus]WIM99686.1 NAD-dependent epimerase/dehydratase family protein [Actinoplanes oblitus]
MRAVVTGAAGFIGSHLVEALLAAGHEVLAVDVAGRRAADPAWWAHAAADHAARERAADHRTSRERVTDHRASRERGADDRDPRERGTDDRHPRERVTDHRASRERGTDDRDPRECLTGDGTGPELAADHRDELARAGVTVAECDLAVDDLAPLADSDVVLHLAGRPGVRDSGGPLTWRDNVTTTERLVEACAGRGTRLVLASSSSVYGSAARPCDEDDGTAPLSPYAKSKAAAEEIVRRGGCAGVILRYFSVYGPRQRPDMAFHRFIEAGLDGVPAPLFGDGGQSRSFTYVGDVVAATVRAAEIPLPHGTVLNVGSPMTVTVGDALDRIGRLLGTTPPTVSKDPAPGDVTRTWAGTERAARLLGWTAGTGLDDGLARQIAWHRERRRG